ncbi:osteopetrosis-associated transmembrane protein 1 [Pristis pectinata]|uniref:osteopetrosis-associated transmembrane protein 1 n=1 Tax=Pristis pectinata TaxID=685728 RepID=UPI00223DDC69|nr:osteopetrosis-associated transmembrane protein 1 [Pristis pectinata]
MNSAGPSVIHQAFGSSDPSSCQRLKENKSLDFRFGRDKKEQVASSFRLAINDPVIEPGAKHRSHLEKQCCPRKFRVTEQAASFARGCRNAKTMHNATNISGPPVFVTLLNSVPVSADQPLKPSTMCFDYSKALLIPGLVSMMLGWNGEFDLIEWQCACFSGPTCLSISNMTINVQKCPKVFYGHINKQQLTSATPEALNRLNNGLVEEVNVPALGWDHVTRSGSALTSPTRARAAGNECAGVVSGPRGVRKMVDVVVLSSVFLGLIGEGALSLSSSVGLQPDFSWHGHDAAAAAAPAPWLGGVDGPLTLVGVREARSPPDWEGTAGWWMSFVPDGSQLSEEQAVSQRCRQLLAEFGDSCKALVGCAVKNARPVRICEKCLSLFHDFWDAFANISKDSGNVSCSTQLLRSDRLQIVLKTQKFLQQLWTGSQCDACLNENKTALSTDTVIFKKLLNDTLTCFEQHSLKHPVHSNHSDLCIKCKVSYNNLTEYYGRMETNKNLCIDIIDEMNLTRQLWSKTYNCTIRDSDIVPVIAVSTFLLFLPVIFYLSSFLHSEQKKLKLIEPKRLKHSSSNSSTH